MAASFPVELYGLTESEPKPERLAKNAALFTLSNGYIGWRGDFEEGFSSELYAAAPGSYVSGFCESEDAEYGEYRFGFAQKRYKITELPDAKRIKLYLGDEPFDMATGDIELYSRRLSFSDATLTRKLRWTSPGGQTVDILTERFVSHSDHRLAGIRYEIIPIDVREGIRLVSGIDCASVSPALAEQGGGVMRVAMKNESTGLCCSMAVCHTLGVAEVARETLTLDDLGVWRTWQWNSAPRRIVLTKWIAYDCDRTELFEDTLINAEQTVKLALSRGWNTMMRAHKEAVSDFWKYSDIVVDGDSGVQQALRFTIYSLMCSFSTCSRTGIPINGLTGTAERGLVSWENDIYTLPFLLYNAPERARALVEKRWEGLDAARARAREVGLFPGALFPYKTICGQYSAEYLTEGYSHLHVSGDVAFAAELYMRVTQDKSFLPHAAELLAETARLWIACGFYNKNRSGAFCINAVTGPDDYNCVVNNNCYTNLMARKNLECAAVRLEQYKREDSEGYAKLVNRIGLTKDELAAWKKAARAMYIPSSGPIHLQDDGFLDRIPMTNEFKNSVPLCERVLPLRLYSLAVCRQPDLLLAMTLMPEYFTAAQLEHNFDYYLPLTINESPLSLPIIGLLSSRLGLVHRAEECFAKTVRSELDGKNGTGGVAIGGLGGVWLQFVSGFGGCRLRDDNLVFSPTLPVGCNGYRFTVFFRGRRIRISVNKAGARAKLLSGDKITVWISGEAVELAPRREDD